MNGYERECLRYMTKDDIGRAYLEMYDYGWRKEDCDELMYRYGMKEEEAIAICARLARIEEIEERMMEGYQ